MNIHEALEPPLDVEGLLEAVPELRLARGLEQSPYHHLDTLEHILETVRGVDRELEERRLGARVEPDRVAGLRLVGLLHDIAKPATHGEVDGRVLFVAHDALGATLVHRVCRRLGLCAALTDLAATLTVLHLKIGFMGHPRSDYPAPRLARAAGPFGEELAVLCWADRLAARGPRLKEEHLERHRDLCLEFLRTSRGIDPHPEPDYGGIAKRLGLPRDDAADAGADAGHASSRIRILTSRGLAEEEALSLLCGSLEQDRG